MSAPTVYIDGQAGTTGLQIYDRLSRRQDIQLLTIDPDKRKDPAERKAMMERADLTFLCLPDDAAREAVMLAEGTATRIIDASTAHRTDPGWVYGLPELHARRREIAAAQRVANPGCYATGVITLVKPLVDNGLLPVEYALSVHALSGYTGGGNKAIAQYEDPGRDGELDSPRHYALTLSHKHIPEIMRECRLRRKPIFCPIICDFPQGMVVTVPIHLNWLGGIKLQDLRRCYQRYYQDERLITLLPPGTPQDGFLGSNNKGGKDDLEILVCGDDEQAVVISRLDNLGKGAAGAAVQNMNLMLGLPEYTGLTL